VELLAAMIPGEIVDLLHQLLLHCPANIWHEIKATNHYDYNLQLAISLNGYQYETILLVRGILNRRGNLLCITRQHIEELLREVQEKITLEWVFDRIPPFFTICARKILCKVYNQDTAGQIS
jgi:hypothetical protein